MCLTEKMYALDMFLSGTSQSAFGPELNDMNQQNILNNVSLNKKTHIKQIYVLSG